MGLLSLFCQAPIGCSDTAELGMPGLDAGASSDAHYTSDGGLRSDAATSWRSRVVDFDDMAGGVTVTDQYDDVRFASGAPCTCQTSSSAGVAASQPNYLLTYFACDDGYRAPIFLDFPVPVGNVSLTAVGVNTDAKFATLRVYRGDVAYDRDLIGAGDPYTPVLVDLSTQAGITRLELVDVDDFVGIGIDDLRFDVPAI